MKRREFIAGLGSAAGWPLLVRAQQQTKPVIGSLHLLPGGEVLQVSRVKDHLSLPWLWRALRALPCSLLREAAVNQGAPHHLAGTGDLVKRVSVWRVGAREGALSISAMVVPVGLERSLGDPVGWVR